ncbi:hypothetical protein [Pseudomonas sp. F(2018)]|uniref:hypothetical protein n=1 Tax=Pseudomonas sp. F(2018) TaxID=2502240 RepID=UPI0010F605B1|nr:hypothetical protein [Pseudomonas sp. F(2018)]
MATLKLNFEADWIKALRTEMKTVWGDPVDQIDDRDVPVSFFDSFRRAIPAHARAVELSDVFTVPPELDAGWNNLAGKVKAGIDLRPHLSGGHQLLSNLDGLLNDWGIHHFHLGIKPDHKNADLVERTRPLVLAYVTEDTFYAIGIFAHTPAPWTKSELIETLHRNWPGAIARFRMNSSSANDLTEEQRARARAIKFNPYTKVSDGTVYAPPGGIMSRAGTDIQATIQADKWREEIRALQSDCLRHQETILEAAGLSHLPGTVEARLRFGEEGHYLLRFPDHGTIVELVPTLLSY